MDRISQLRDETGTSRDSSMESPGHDSFLTANDSSSKYYSLSEVESSFDITPINDVTLASTAEGVTEKTLTQAPSLISDLSVGKKNDLLSYKIGKQIEAANILSGGVNIFDNDNSYDGHELVIDDDVNIEEKSNSESLLINSELSFEKAEENDVNSVGETDIAVKDTEVVLQIDGNNVNAIDIGNGLYLYRKDGEEELAAVQILDDDQSQPSFKFLKVRENNEGNLEVYEEIEIEVPKEVPDKQEPISENITAHVPIRNINKVICEPTTTKTYERKNKTPQTESKQNQVETETCQDVVSETKAEVSFNVKMKLNEARKSPVVGSFTPMTQSTPNKEGIPLTKIMVHQQLHPNRHSDNIKKTIEVHTDSCKQRLLETPTKFNKDSSDEGKISQLITSENIKDKILVSEIDKKINEYNTSSKENTVGKDEICKEAETKRKGDIITKVDEQEHIKSHISEKELIFGSSTTDISGPTMQADCVCESKENIEIIKKLSTKSQTTCISSKEFKTANEIESLSESSCVKQTDDPNKSKIHVEDETREIVEISKDRENFETNINSMSLEVTECNQIEDEKSDEINNKNISHHISDSLATKIKKNEENSVLNIVNLNDDKGSIYKSDLQSLCKSLLTENKETNPNSRSIIEMTNPKQDELEEIKNDKNDIINQIVELKLVQGDNIEKMVEKSEDDISSNNIKADRVENIDEKDEVLEKTDDAKEKPDNIVKEFKPKDNVKVLCVNHKSTKSEPVNNNNNAAVPFGKWTEANRQEFLNKIKVKTSTNNANTNQIKQTNDLNRRDVLKNYDIQRQTNNAIAKSNESINVKNESLAFVSKNITVKETKPAIKIESSTTKTKIISLKKDAKLDLVSKSQVKSTNLNVKNETMQRKEINNQDLIDKTIEHNLLGLINKPVNVSAKHNEEGVKQKQVHEIQKDDHNYADIYQTKVFRDDVERRMNELHGIPFVERPAHELPRISTKDDKNDDINQIKSDDEKGTKIPKLLPLKNKSISSIEIDSDDEVIEHEPITGDIDVKVKSKSYNVKEQQLIHGINADPNKETIITENDFDKFARRNSINCENRLTVKLDMKKPQNNVRSKVEKEISNKNYSMTIVNTQHQKTLTQNKYPKTSNVSPNDDLHNRPQSKLQMAYQSVLTAKRQMESPITVIEDKPVKVMYVETSMDFVPSQLNVQGKELSPSKKISIETETAGACESMDSDILDAIYECKPHEETAAKTKHPRKQVLTPVDTPEIELIEPKDLGLELSPKKRRKIEDNKDKLKEERSTKNLIPKKSYLLGRNMKLEEKETTPLPENRNPVNKVDSIISLNDTKETDSAIDKLVKAAELIETQSENNKTVSPELTPVRRGRGRPRKYPLPDGGPQDIKIHASSPKKPRLIDAKPKKKYISSSENESDSDDDGEIIKENWTMGKINENNVCPICGKLFRSENVIFKHVKHCTGPSPNRSDKDKRVSRSLRTSHDSDTKLSEIKSDVTDIEMEYPLKKFSKHTPQKRKSFQSNSSNSKYDNDIIVIEDTPLKDTKQEKKKSDDALIKTSNIKQQLTNTLMCEFCGKTFRQLSYLTNHKLKHKSQEPKKTEIVLVTEKSIFNCETCKKDFRKLHHLVQHRLIHKPLNVTSSRVSRQSADKDNKVMKNVESLKLSEDLIAGFRCERCDKSFRKLHHLVEHRETHDGLDKQKATITPNNTEKPILPPQCDVCKKTFRKLHHLIEHKEQHLETSSEKSDDKSVKSSLSTKDIIHECCRCYMVFPNEHSLNKHSIICEKKKRQSAAKQAKQAAGESQTEDEITNDKLEEESIGTEENDIEIVETHVEAGTVNIREESPIALVVEKADSLSNEKFDKEKTPPKEQLDTAIESKVPLPTRTSVDIVTYDSHTQTSINVSEIITNTDFDTTTTESPINKIHIKEKIAPTVTKRLKTVNLPLPVIDQPKSILESSDDEDVRYMLNPNFKPEESLESKLFMKINKKKRNSLPFERPCQKELVKRKTPKIPRLKPKPLEYRSLTMNNPTVQKVKPSIVEKVSIDSDDSDVKYSFPKAIPEKVCNLKGEMKITKKIPLGRKSITDKRRSLSGIAKRKSMGKLKVLQQNILPTIKKRRTAQVEHRCDCGQLFSSAALLSRHTTLAHTPPRIRRRRSTSPNIDTTTVVKGGPRKSSVVNKTGHIAKPGLRKSSVADKLTSSAKTGSRKSSVSDKITSSAKTGSRKSSVGDKITLSAKAGARKSSVADKTPQNAKMSSRKSSVADKTLQNDKTSSRKSTVADKTAHSAKAGSRKSSVAENTTSSGKAGSRKSSVADNATPNVKADSRKSSVVDKTTLTAKTSSRNYSGTIKTAQSGKVSLRKSNVVDKTVTPTNIGAGVLSRNSSVADKIASSTSTRKSNIRLDTNTKPGVVSRKSIVKDEDAIKRVMKSLKTRVSPIVGASGVKRKRSEAHSGVPVPEKMKNIHKLLL